MKSFLLGLSLLCSYCVLYSQINYVNWIQGKDLSLPGHSANKIDVFIFVSGSQTDGVIKLPAESQKLIDDLERKSLSMDFENFTVNVVRAIEIKNNMAFNAPTSSNAVCKKLGLLEVGGMRLSTAFTADPYFILIDTSFFDTNPLILARKSTGKYPFNFVTFRDCNGNKTIPFVNCSNENDLLALIVREDYNFAYLVNEIKKLCLQVNELKEENLQQKRDLDSLGSRMVLSKKK